MNIDSAECVFFSKKGNLRAAQTTGRWDQVVEVPGVVTAPKNRANSLRAVVVVVAVIRVCIPGTILPSAGPWLSLSLVLLLSLSLLHLATGSNPGTQLR